MKLERDLVSIVFFVVSMMSWMIILAITPIGGWNENSITYQSWYKPAFGITSIVFLISIITMIIALNSSKPKASC